MTENDRNPAAELAQALEALAEVLAGDRTPDRFDVRALFLPLGALVLEGDIASLTPTLEHLGGAIEGRREAWEAAVASELELAGDEFCRSVDPRYLGLPNYDLDYTLASREFLACRIQAALQLGFALPAGLEGRVEKADKALDPYL